MEKVVLIGGALLLVAYSVFTETLDWIGRIELIREHFPRFPEFFERRLFRVVLIIVAVVLLIRVAIEHDNNRVATSGSPITLQPASLFDQEKSEPLQKQSDARPATPSIPRPRTTKKLPAQVEQHGTGSGAVGGNVSQGPCSSLQVGGSNNQSTVNCGPLPPPSLQLTWTVRDIIPPQMSNPSTKNFNYEKLVTVRVNTSWNPVAVAVVCDTQVGEIDAQPFRGGAVMNFLTGVDGNAGWASFQQPAITPSNPLLVQVWSIQFCRVLDVRPAIIKGVND